MRLQIEIKLGDSIGYIASVNALKLFFQNTTVEAREREMSFLFELA